MANDDNADDGADPSANSVIRADLGKQALERHWQICASLLRSPQRHRRRRGMLSVSGSGKPRRTPASGTAKVAASRAYRDGKRIRTLPTLFHGVRPPNALRRRRLPHPRPSVTHRIRCRSHPSRQSPVVSDRSLCSRQFPRHALGMFRWQRWWGVDATGNQCSDTSTAAAYTTVSLPQPTAKMSGI